MKLSEKAAYINGLIDGLNLDPQDKQTKIFKLIAELLGEMAEEIGQLEQCYDDVSDQIDGIGEDLAGVENLLYSEDLEGLEYSDVFSDDDEPYEVVCPTCERTITIGEEVLSAGCLKCPGCGQLLEFDYVPDELDPQTASDDDQEEDPKGKPEDE